MSGLFVWVFFLPLLFLSSLFFPFWLSLSFSLFFFVLFLFSFLFWPSFFLRFSVFCSFCLYFTLPTFFSAVFQSSFAASLLFYAIYFNIYELTQDIYVQPKTMSKRPGKSICAPPCRQGLPQCCLWTVICPADKATEDPASSFTVQRRPCYDSRRIILGLRFFFFFFFL